MGTPTLGHDVSGLKDLTDPLRQGMSADTPLAQQVEAGMTGLLHPKMDVLPYYRTLNFMQGHYAKALKEGTMKPDDLATVFTQPDQTLFKDLQAAIDAKMQIPGSGGKGDKAKKPQVYQQADMDALKSVLGDLETVFERAFVLKHDGDLHTRVGQNMMRYAQGKRLPEHIQPLYERIFSVATAKGRGEPNPFADGISADPAAVKNDPDKS